MKPPSPAASLAPRPRDGLARGSRPRWPSPEGLRRVGLEFLQTHLFGPGRREGLARALEETDPERDGHYEEAERLRSELAELAVRIRRQVSHLEAPEAAADAAAGKRLRELAALKTRRERELEAAERVPATKPDREQARELVDLLPQLNVDAALLTDATFRDLLAALDFRATFQPDRNELRMRAVLAPELLAVTENGTSAPLSVPPAGTGRKGRNQPSVFLQLEAGYRVGADR